MRTKRLNKQTPRLAVAAAVVVALAAVACNGDDASPNATIAPGVTPGSGAVPIEAMISYINANGLDGHQLDPNREAKCPFEEVIGTPGVASRIHLGQFCLISKDYEPEKALTIIAELPDTGETWEIKLEFDADASLWKIKEVDKVSG